MSLATSSPARATSAFTALGHTLSKAVLGSLAPLDLVRSRSYRLLARRFTGLLREPERRTFWFALIYLFLALTATLLWPLGLLALGPIFWGIPHLLGDVRYLVLRPGYHRARLRLGLVCAALAVSMLGGGIVAGIAAVALAVALTKAPWRARLGLLAPTLLTLALVCWQRRPAELVFAHLHNLVAAAWLIASFRGASRRWALAVAYAVAVGCLFWVPLAQAPLLLGGLGGMDWGYHLLTLTPATASEWWLRLVLVFAFAQAFHYAVWVRLVPELGRTRRAPRGFSASYRALQTDFGVWPLLLVAASMLLLALGAVFALRESREAYLRFALFHGYLELAFMAVAWLEAPQRRRPSSAGESAA